MYWSRLEQSDPGIVLHPGGTSLASQAFANMVVYSSEEILAFSIEDALNLNHPLLRTKISMYALLSVGASI